MRFCAARASSCGVVRALGGRGGGVLGARLQLAADGLVALGALDGLAVALDLALDVRHVGRSCSVLLGLASNRGDALPAGLAGDSRHIRARRYALSAGTSRPMDLSRLRNLSIVAHVDHGKSTLADRLLELCGAVDPRDMRAQYLDSMDIERERGITIKLQSVRLDYRDHVINLIDTPGHVDFGYEVSRSLAACEGVILLVDAAQGIEAQTLANCYLALENDLEIVACLNKLDLPAADPDRCASEIEQVLGIPAEDILRISAKTGDGVPELLDAVIEHIPAPTGDPTDPLQALIFDSYYDSYRGVVSSVRVMTGTLKTGSRLKFMQADAVHDADEIGVRRPDHTPVAGARPGRDRLPHRRHQGRARGPLGRDGHRRRPARRRAARGLPRAEADGVLRAVPDRRRPVLRPARRAREAPPQRRLLHLRARDLRRARLRLPVRLPRAAPHGDHPGAAGARVQPRPDRHRSVGRVPRAQDRRRGDRGRQPVGPARDGEHRVHRGADAHLHDPHARRTTRARSWSSARTGGAR